ncbi:X-ray radiation resistance-associated protein 1 [Spea bombifrons]|uniref:X-ray radiation resistance-associated protein 1 n=1 Tax=Spea bombifrons TaxID=233779 RepID=UPI00234A918F|nr:X-ray radiation resistance-associated protein 1 [Spea bombifrons]
MASDGPYKMDNGGIFVSNCFPARSLFRLTNRGAGHWQVVHKAAPERRFRAVVGSASSNQTSRSDPEKTSVLHRQTRSSLHGTSDNLERVLDGSFLMKTHFVARPTDLCSVDVSDRNLTSAKRADFVQFNSVAYINAAENLLTLEDFRTFPAIRELDLSMNALTEIRVKHGDFPHLEVLDVSYNNLTPKAISRLSFLPRLRVLHLTGNRLTHLPASMSVPHDKDPDFVGFPSLEILMLEDNKLSDPAVFASLANLKSLRQLNLARNGIAEVPYLRETVPTTSTDSLSGGQIKQDSDTDIHERRGQRKMPEATSDDGGDISYTVLQNASDPDRTHVIFSSTYSSPNSHLPKFTVTPKSSSFLPSSTLSAMASTDSSSQIFSPPFPNLRHLSLVDNKIAYEEDLLAVALFPSLEELLIHGNPLTTHRKGDSTLLRSFLQERLGISVIRRKSAETPKPHIFIPVKETRKVKTHVPKIPKQPLMLEPPSYPFLGFLFDRSGPASGETQYRRSPGPLPPIRTSPQPENDEAQHTSHGVSPETSGEEEILPGSDPAAESVFMTQVDNVLDSQRIPSPVSASHLDVEKEEVVVAQKDIPEKFKGYEELFDVKTDPGFIEPVGIQNNVKALEYALKHLLLCRDFKPRLPRIQKTSVLNEVKALPNKHKADPVPRPTDMAVVATNKSDLKTRSSPRKSKREVVAEVITSMRETTQVTQEPLDRMLKNSSKDRKKAQQLLNELQQKYRTFYAEMVKRAADLERSLLDTAQRLREAEEQLGTMGAGVKPGER